MPFLYQEPDVFHPFNQETRGRAVVILGVKWNVRSTPELEEMCYSMSSKATLQTFPPQELRLQNHLGDVLKLEHSRA